MTCSSSLLTGLFTQSNDVTYTPNALTNSRFHCRRYSERLMNPREVVIHVVECNGVNVILDLFREGIGQPGKPTKPHPHAKILALDVAGRDVLRIWIAKKDFLFDAQTLRGAVPLLGFWIVSVNLDELRVVDIISKSVDDGKQVHLVAVRGQLGLDSTHAWKRPPENR